MREFKDFWIRVLFKRVCNHKEPIKGRETDWKFSSCRFCKSMEGDLLYRRLLFFLSSSALDLQVRGGVSVFLGQQTLFCNNHFQISMHWRKSSSAKFYPGRHWRKLRKRVTSWRLWKRGAEREKRATRIFSGVRFQKAHEGSCRSGVRVWIL